VASPSAPGWRHFLLYGSASKPTLTTADVLDHMVDGMNYTPAAPKFEDTHDGILASIDSDASLTASDRTRRSCLVWDAFADFGVGVGAKATVKRSGSVTVVESFDRFASCNAFD
jgi:extracellular elastinolytic metalloproteinase